jgi:hypothetical protein
VFLALGPSIFMTLIPLCNVAFFYSFSSFPKIIEKDKKNQIYPKKRKGKVFSFLVAHESPLDKAHPFVCSSIFGT